MRCSGRDRVCAANCACVCRQARLFHERLATQRPRILRTDRSGKSKGSRSTVMRTAYERRWDWEVDLGSLVCTMSAVSSVTARLQLAYFAYTLLTALGGA